MTNTSNRILFFGNERLVSGLSHTDAPILTGLLQRGYDIRAVISHHSDSKSRTNRHLEVADIATAHGIPVHLPEKPGDIHDLLASYGAEAAILVAYGRIIPQSVIDIFPKGIVNIHPSLLPKYRGPTPIESAITNGDTITGVSIIQLSAGMDAGPIYAQADAALHGTETKFDLYDTLSREAATLLFDSLPTILDGSLVPIAQDEARATYCQLFSKADAQLQAEKLTAREAEQRIRAHLVFPKTKFRLLDTDIVITEAHVSSTKKTLLDIVCQDGAFLSIDELIAPSGKTMNASAFLNGYAAG